MNKEQRNRREWELTFDVREIIDRQKKDEWRYDGGFRRRGSNGLFHIPALYNGMTPIDLITKKVNSGECNLMVLGPARGEDLGVSYEMVESRLTDPQNISRLKVDVFGLTKTITAEVENIVREDYSGTLEKPSPFEFFENPDLVGAYDVVVGEQSVGVHTHHPLRALVKSATLLAPGGVGFIEFRVLPDTDIKQQDPGWIQERFQRYFKGKGKNLDIKIVERKEPEEIHPFGSMALMSICGEMIPKMPEVYKNYWAVIERK